MAHHPYARLEAAWLRHLAADDLYTRKKAELLLRVNLVLLCLLLCLVVPIHLSGYSEKPFLIAGDLLLAVGGGLALVLLSRGRSVVAATVSTLSMMGTPLFHNVATDWYRPVGVTADRYYETWILLLIFFPVVCGFAFRLRQLLLASFLLAATPLCHFFVLRHTGHIDVPSSSLVYLVAAVLPGTVSIMNLRLSNTAIGTLVDTSRQIGEWNKTLEATVALRTSELTERVASEQKARQGLESAVLFRQQLLDTIPIPVFYKDDDLVYVGCNESYAKFLGLDQSGIVGKTVFDVAPPELARVYQEKDLQLMERRGTQTYECEVDTNQQAKRLVVFHKATFENREGRIAGIVGAIMDITDIRQAEKQKELMIADLQAALEKVKLLSGLLPICASCKKIRDDKGYWNQIESYIRERSEAEFSHGICPDCMHKLYGEFVDDPR